LVEPGKRELVHAQLCLYSVYTMKQTGNKPEANLEHPSCTCILNMFGSCLVHVCFLV